MTSDVKNNLIEYYNSGLQNIMNKPIIDEYTVINLNINYIYSDTNIQENCEIYTYKDVINVLETSSYISFDELDEKYIKNGTFNFCLQTCTLNITFYM